MSAGGGLIKETWKIEGIGDLGRRPEGIIQVKRYVRDLPGGCSQAPQEPLPHRASSAQRSAPLRRRDVSKMISDGV